MQAGSFSVICRRLALSLALLSSMLLHEHLAIAQSQEAGSASFARQTVRIDQLETEIRRITGQNESINFKIDQLERQLKSLKDAMNLAEEKIEGFKQLNSSAQSVQNGTSVNGSRVQEKSASLRSQAPVTGSENGAKALGVLRVGKGITAKSGDPIESLSPAQLYQKAQGFLAKGRELEKAVELLKIFVARYPEHKLASNAYHWLGRAYFVRRDYRRASFAFAEGLQRFPKSPKASSNLLNLGMAFLKLGKKTEACTAWRQLSAYPKAPDAIKRRVQGEIKKAKCF